MKLDLARSLRHVASPTAESRSLEKDLDDMGVELSALFPDVEPSIEEMVKQFSGQLPDEIVDKRLDAVRALSGVEAAYKKPPAEPASVD